ncbi:hypothetical protein Tco_0491782, partial [Tanacetum coccineum]
MLPMIISIHIPHMLHLEGKLFDSRGCLVLVRRDYIRSSEFIIYKMTKGCSVWSIKYIVDIDDFMTLLPEGWSIRYIVWILVVGEREDDSFLVMNLSGKVVQYNLISKTVSEIYDMGYNEVADDYLHGFIPPFAMYDMGYKKLDHKIRESPDNEDKEDLTCCRYTLERKEGVRQDILKGNHVVTNEVCYGVALIFFIGLGSRVVGLVLCTGFWDYNAVFDCDDDAISQSLINLECIKDFWMANMNTNN